MSQKLESTSDMKHHQDVEQENCHSHTCGIVPPHILRALASSDLVDSEVRAAAAQSLVDSQHFRETRDDVFVVQDADSIGPARLYRKVYTANNLDLLPGAIVRTEGEGPAADLAVNQTYDGFRSTFDFYYNVLGRNSINNLGMDLIGTVHYKYRYNNAFWNGVQMIFGDGDGVIFTGFTQSLDVIAHELTHGVVQYSAGLVYQNQSGALNESISDVFGVLTKQYNLNQTAAQADWLVGQGILGPTINGVALRSMKAPGTAYDDPILGKDPQPSHMSNFVVTTEDNGGVHINSGIPNYAFYRCAIAFGGQAWEKAGKIWYLTLTDSRLLPTATFVQFADLTLDAANRSYGASGRDIVLQAWKDVGVY